MSSTDLPVFSFGTLLNPRVQEHLFGHTVHAQPTELADHDVVDVPILDPAVIAASGKDVHPGVVRRIRRSVAGALLHLDAAQLAAADAYEVAAYTRRRTLTRTAADAETHPAWAYLSANPLAVAQRIAVIGDSIAYGRASVDGGWAAALGAWHVGRDEAEHRLHQLAYPGTTIRRIAQHILPELTARKADTVLISAGINDLLLDGTSPRELVELVQRLCADLEAEGIRPVVLGPTWLDAQRVRTVLGHEVDPDLVREHRERLAAWARQTHRDHLDPWPVLEGHPERVRADGLHPDAEGHRMLARWLLGLAQGPAEDWQPA